METLTYWEKSARRLRWEKSFTQVFSGSLASGDIRWFEDGMLNASANCVDRHLETRADQIALIWEGDTPEQQKNLSFKTLHESICRLSNVLKERGVQKGDRVCLYLPMIPEAIIAMLACARIGAIHSVVFAGFSENALQSRIEDAKASCVITADGSHRGGKDISLKSQVDFALKSCPLVHTVIVVPHTRSPIEWKPGRDLNYEKALSEASPFCPYEIMHAEDPLFILYTSGSTGKPKGILHTTGGYLTCVHATFLEVFQPQSEDIYWCTADVGWITGHSYIVYGPLSHGTTTLIYEGVPHYPNASRYWEMIDRHRVSIFYTAPTALRSLMREGNIPLHSSHRESLRLLGTVGEPINPEAWHWYDQAIGKSRCPIMDTWWQTETGGILMAPLVDKKAQKPGAAMRALPGIVPDLVDSEGNLLEGEASGQLVISTPWPGMLRTLYGDHERFLNTYLKIFPGHYYTGDGASRDADGDYWITGRIDDVLNVCGHRLGSAELESALVLHPQVAEAAVVGFPHGIKGEGIYAFVTLMQGKKPSDPLKAELISHVRQVISPIATIDRLQFALELPKTRSGKIMRRFLKQIAAGTHAVVGDTSTLANPEVLQALIQEQQLSDTPSKKRSNSTGGDACILSNKLEP